MARARMITMDQKEEDLIHDMSIKCLNEIGVCIHCEKVLKRGLPKLKLNLLKQVFQSAPCQCQWGDLSTGYRCRDDIQQ